MLIIRALTFLFACGLGARTALAWQDAPDVKAMCHNCGETDARPDSIREQWSAWPADSLPPSKSQWAKSLENMRAADIARLPREIIRLDNSQLRVDAPTENMDAPSGSIIFGIAGAGVLDDARRPTGFTPGTRISALNLMRSFSILQKMSEAAQGGLGIEDYRFLAQQAEFALEPDAPLQVIVSQVQLNSNVSGQEAAEVHAAAEKIFESGRRIADCLAQEKEIVLGLQEIEDKMENAAREDSEGRLDLKKRYDDKFALLLDIVKNERQAREEIMGNRAIIREITGRYVDLRVKPRSLMGESMEEIQ